MFSTSCIVKHYQVVIQFKWQFVPFANTFCIVNSVSKRNILMAIFEVILVSEFPPWFSISSHPYPEHYQRTGQKFSYPFWSRQVGLLMGYLLSSTIIATFQGFFRQSFYVWMPFLSLLPKQHCWSAEGSFCQKFVDLRTKSDMYTVLFLKKK